MRIGWLDFSSEERAKINAILEQLKEKSNLDELGLAPIRDGFANLFFPGMSTLINRAKYFLIVPYALKDLEKCQGPNLAGRLQEIERDCAQKLVAGSTLPYIIGRRSLNHGSWVSLARRIFWTALAAIARIWRNSKSFLSISAHSSAVRKTRCKMLPNYEALKKGLPPMLGPFEISGGWEDVKYKILHPIIGEWKNYDILPLAEK